MGLKVEEIGKMKQSTLSISFEYFPPKTPESEEKLLQTTCELKLFNPDFFSVTFGAGGSTRVGTFRTAKMLQEQEGVLVAPHLACIGSTHDEMLACIDSYQALGMRRIVALRGDVPSGMGYAGEFKYASELVEVIRTATGEYFNITVAAYPEIHPQALSAHDDVLNLKRKFEVGANSAITQYFFNPDAYFYYREECMKNGIHMPIIPGIMPVTQFSKLARFSEMCGAEIPRWMRKRLESYGDDVESVQKFGLEVVVNLCERLIEGGVSGLHFYTLNNGNATKNVLQSLGISSKEPKL